MRRIFSVEAESGAGCRQLTAWHQAGSISQEYPADGDELVNAALGDVLGVYSTILQNPAEEPTLARSDFRLLDSVVGRYSSFLSRDECSALRCSLDSKISKMQRCA